MNKTFKDKSEERFYNNFNKQVEQYINEKTSKPQAIALVAKKMNLNPYKIINQFYPEMKSTKEQNVDDIQSMEGSFVYLKNNPSKNQYEVININNKDAIVLRNVDNNEEITASETEITPVITENKMTKLDEAQYNISINGLETEDAVTLSQMLDLANQAENTNDSLVSNDNIQSDITVNPEPMDVDTGMPMDMDEPNMSMDNEPTEEDDIEFDEELPSDTDLNTEITPSMDMEIDTYENPEDTSNMMDNSSDLNMDFENNQDMSMDDMMDSGIYDTMNDSETDVEEELPEETNEEFDYDALMNEALEAAYNSNNLNETEEKIPADDFIDDEGQLKGEQEQYAEDITENEEPEDDFDSEIAEALRLAGVQLNEEEFDDDFDSEEDNDLDSEDDEELQKIKDEFLSGDFDDDSIKHELIDGGYASTDEEAQKMIDEWSQSDFEEEPEDDFDSEIAEALRLAGVQLNEEETNGPEIINDETLYINEDNEDNEPQYKAVDVDTFGKDASEGSKKSMTFESTINLNKIKSIYETAKSMYAKKDAKDWLSLDRRYTEKLIREGVGFAKASKMLIEAKKGK